MAALMHCLLQSCLEEQDDQASSSSSLQQRTSYEPPSATRMLRSPTQAATSTTVGTSFASGAQGIPHEGCEEKSAEEYDENDGEEDDDDDCCRPEPASLSSSTRNDQQTNNGIQRFFWWRPRNPYQTLEHFDQGEETTNTTASTSTTTGRQSRIHPVQQQSESPPLVQRSSAPFGMFRRANSSGSGTTTATAGAAAAAAAIGASSSSILSQSPLQTASSFRQSKEGIPPSIEAQQVVLPGSALQEEMAAHMASTLLLLDDDDALQADDECVICMEGFDSTNPRMPTLCGCGENKTYFHLPCLYQWIEQSRECPTCRKRLRWEEF